MKKIISLFVVLMFVTNIVFAQTEDVELTDEIKGEAKKKGSVALCVRYLKDKFPNAGLHRLNSECKNLVQNIVDKAQVGQVRKLSARKLQNTAGLNEAEQKKLSHLNRQKIKDLATKNVDELKQALTHYKVNKFANKADMFRARTVKNYQELKHKYSELKDKYSELKDELKELRKEFKDAVESGDEETALEHSKQYLTKVADLVINNLEKIKAKVEENDDLTEDEVTEMLADLDEKIQVIEDAKSDVDSAETKEEVKEAGQAIIHAWKRMQHKVKLHAGRVIKANVQDVLKRAEHLERKLEKALVKLEEQGYDVSEVEDLVELFSEEVESARTKFKDASEMFKQARELADSEEGTQEEVDDLVEQAKALVKEAHEDLKEAHEVSKEIIESIRDTAGSVESVTEEDEEDEEDYVVVEEVDDDEDSDSEEEDSEEESEEVEESEQEETGEETS